MEKTGLFELVFIPQKSQSRDQCQGYSGPRKQNLTRVLTSTFTEEKAGHSLHRKREQLYRMCMCMCNYSSIIDSMTKTQPESF